MRDSKLLVQLLAFCSPFTANALEGDFPIAADEGRVLKKEDRLRGLVAFDLRNTSPQRERRHFGHQVRPLCLRLRAGR